MIHLPFPPVKFRPLSSKRGQERRHVIAPLMSRDRHHRWTWIFGDEISLHFLCASISSVGCPSFAAPGVYIFICQVQRVATLQASSYSTWASLFCRSIYIRPTQFYLKIDEDGVKTYAQSVLHKTKGSKTKLSDNQSCGKFQYVGESGSI